MDMDIDCTRCGNSQSAEIYGDDTEVECEVCGATLDVTVTVDVELSATPPAEGECPNPECGEGFTVEDLTEESGNVTLTCAGCQHELDVTWSDWGRDVQVEDRDEDDDDDDDDDEEEDDEEEEDEEDIEEGDDD